MPAVVLGLLGLFAIGLGRAGQVKSIDLSQARTACEEQCSKCHGLIERDTQGRAEALHGTRIASNDMLLDAGFNSLLRRGLGQRVKLAIRYNLRGHRRAEPVCREFKFGEFSLTEIDPHAFSSSAMARLHRHCDCKFG